jgi:D-aspartate ligase
MSVEPCLPTIVTAMNLNGLGVARVLGRHGVPVIGIHGADPGVEVKSRYLKERWQRGPASEDLLTLLREKGPGFVDRPVLIPITDESVLLIADNLEELRRHYRIAMPEPQLVRDLIDKEKMRAIAEQHGVTIPHTWHVTSDATFERMLEQVGYPCILKPAGKESAWQAAGLLKAYVCEDRQALLDAWERASGLSAEVVVQQFIAGGDESIYFTLMYCCKGGDATAVLSGRKLRQWRPHCGGTSASEPVEDTTLDETARSFFASVGMHGLCSLEYKKDPRDGCYYMIEPTICRPDWQNGVADSNGVPLAWIAYCDLAELEKPVISRRKRKRRWVYLAWDRQAASYYRQRGELTWLSWMWSIRPPVCGAVFAVDDLRPWMANVCDYWRRGITKLLRLFMRGKQTRRAA